jgi:C1A family cysteine protease
MAFTAAGYGLGWLPDYPDFRDYSGNAEEVKPLLRKLSLEAGGRKRASRASGLKSKQDLRSWCSPIEDQGSIGSCTANAGVGLIEYFERRAHGSHLDASRLFLYKVTRNLKHQPGDTGAFLRTTMGAMKLFGAPPSEYWPYEIANYDNEPPAFCYAFASNYQAIHYFRLDPPNMSTTGLVDNIKRFISAGFPAMFGFTVYTSLRQADTTGQIPFPEPDDKVDGGHAVVAVGYDDNMKIQHQNVGAKVTKGAFLIRNSWGIVWGDAGYGWLPYEYVLESQAIDWWSLIKSEYVETGQFGL